MGALIRTEFAFNVMVLQVFDPRVRAANRRRPPQGLRAAPAAALRRGSDFLLDRVALLAHQLRTPLSAINALAQGLIRRADQLGTSDIQARPRRSGANLRLDELIDTILSPGPAGGIVLNPNEFNLELIRRVCREQGGQEPGRPFKLQTADLMRIVIGDPITQTISSIERLEIFAGHQPRSTSWPEKIRHDPDLIKDQGIGIQDRICPSSCNPFPLART